MNRYIALKLYPEVFPSDAPVWYARIQILTTKRYLKFFEFGSMMKFMVAV